jgi:hypothetical protein
MPGNDKAWNFKLLTYAIRNLALCMPIIGLLTFK